MKLHALRTFRVAAGLFAIFAATISAHAQSATESVVYSFCSQTGCADGTSPAGTLLLAADKNFYGTTQQGGANYNSGTNSAGTVFQLTPAGALKTIYSFCAQSNCSDGQIPMAGLVQDSQGNFYGTTRAGGTHQVSNGGAGTVFKLTSAGALTTLYNFCASGGNSCTDGEGPYAGLTSGGDGNFYGVTSAGGANGGGTVFKITTAGVLTTLYNFCTVTACADGEAPYGGLTLGAGGVLYGATSEDGAYDRGTVFSISTTGVFATVYSFCAAGGSDCADGTAPSAPLALGKDGDFYGTTLDGGTHGFGTAFQITSGGTLTTLHEFCGENCAEGANPYAGLVEGADKNFYGTTQFGGAHNEGTIYGVTSAGGFASLYSFCSAGGTCTDGAEPEAGLVQAADGSFYGVTANGGAHGQGAVFKVVVSSKSASSTTLAASPNPVQVGQSATLTATVTGAGAVATGTVNFTVGTFSLGSKPLNGSGVATLSASSNGTAPGTYPVVATYSGDTTYNVSASAADNVQLNKAATATSLSVSPNPVTPPESVTLTATVSRSASGAAGKPSGTVTFYYQGNALGTGTLNGAGVATFIASSNGLPAGKYAVTAKYNGDSSDAASTSAPFSVTVN